MFDFIFKVFFELFPWFNWDKEIGNLLSIWFGGSILIPCPFCFYSLELMSRILLTFLSIFFPFPLLAPSDNFLALFSTYSKLYSTEVTSLALLPTVFLKFCEVCNILSGIL